MNGIGEVGSVLLLLLFFIVVLGVLARKLDTPYPIVMVVGGLVIGLIPGMPQFTLHPEVVFLVVLPPLLYAAAWTTSWRDFCYNITSILLLAFGLVGFTVAAVAWLAPALFTGFDWRLGFVLGAVVAPTDAIAAAAIARRVGLPPRLVEILEGESLINDASGLLALRFGTVMMLQHVVPSLPTAVFTLVWLVVGGGIVGFLIGWIADYIEHRIDDGPIEITLSILIPYAAYLLAEEARASGVLAVVTCGLFLSRRSATFFSPAVRIQANAVWDALNYVLNGLVFVMIGLQLPAVRASITEYSMPTLLFDGIIFSGLLIALRLIWTYPGAHVSWFIRTRIQKQREKPPAPRAIFVVGWTGMRGVVSLAAALALPTMLEDGSPFPHRGLIIFLTFAAIFVTLVLQGATLPPLIRALGLAGIAGPNCEEQEARRIAIEAAVSHLEVARDRDGAELLEVYDDLTGHYNQRLAALRPEEATQSAKARHVRHVSLSLEALRIERETVIRLRDEGRINDEVLRRLEHELDLNESRIAEG